MSNSPWEVQEQQSGKRFGFVEIETEELNGKNNTTYWKMKLHLVPLNGSSQEWSAFSFGRDWNSVTLPSIINLSNIGKIESPQSLSGNYVQWEVSTWKDYSKNTISYYEENKPEELKFDDKGKQYVDKPAIRFLDVYSDENACIQAQSNEAESNGTKLEQEPPVDNNATEKQVALGFIAPLVKAALNGGNKVDREKLAQMIANNQLIANHFTVDSDEVQAAITEVEKEPAF